MSCDEPLAQPVIAGASNANHWRKAARKLRSVRNTMLYHTNSQILLDISKICSISQRMDCHGAFKGLVDRRDPGEGPKSRWSATRQEDPGPRLNAPRVAHSARHGGDLAGAEQVRASFIAEIAGALL